VYPLYGEKEYTFAEITEEISKVIGRPLRYQQITAWDLKERATGVSENAETRVNSRKGRTTLFGSISRR
jgi:uncharacterized protein YbjT (DUF2867 family)